MSFYNTLTNSIINGKFDFFQRGLNFPSIATATYFADRFKYQKSGTMVHNITRSTDVDTNSTSQYSALLTVTTPQAVLGATGTCEIETYIEGNFASKLYGKNIVLAFKVKSSKTGVYCVRLSNSAGSRVLIKEYTITNANIWERKLIRISLDNVGTWLKDTGKGIEVDWILSAGTSLNTGIADVWGSNYSILSTVGQVNHSDTVGATFQLSEIVLVEDNIGQTSVPNFVLAGRDYAEELFLCQRYFCKTYAIDVPPASIVTDFTGTIVASINASVGGQGRWFFPVRMRITPVVNVYQSNGTVGAAAVQSINEQFATTHGYSAINSLFYEHWKADSDF